MTDEPNTAQPTAVQFHTRPGCPFSSSLRRRLLRAGISFQEVDIWADAAAARLVREITGGAETVPIVRIGPTSLVNPSAAQVRAAVDEHCPHLAGALPPAETDRTSRARTVPALLTLLLTVLWAGLALRQPATTYHLAPLLIAASWPTTAAWSAGSRLATRQAAGAAGMGFAVATLALSALAGTGHLLGPALPGVPNVATEALVLAAAGALAGGMLAARTGAASGDDTEP